MVSPSLSHTPEIYSNLLAIFFFPPRPPPLGEKKKKEKSPAPSQALISIVKINAANRREEQ
jgi:hypothetical protein